MAKEFGWKFADGTDWNSDGSYRLFWFFKDRSADDDGRIFTVVNTATKLDSKWNEILMMALRGHMDPRKFETARITSGSNPLWQITFTEPLLCRYTDEEARRLIRIANFPHERSKVAVWEEGYAYCGACYAEFVRRGWRPLVGGSGVIKIEL